MITLYNYIFLFSQDNSDNSDNNNNNNNNNMDVLHLNILFEEEVKKADRVLDNFMYTYILYIYIYIAYIAYIFTHTLWHFCYIFSHIY